MNRMYRGCWGRSIENFKNENLWLQDNLLRFGWLA